MVENNLPALKEDRYLWIKDRLLGLNIGLGILVWGFRTTTTSFEFAPFAIFSFIIAIITDSSCDKWSKLK